MKIAVLAVLCFFLSQAAPPVPGQALDSSGHQIKSQDQGTKDEKEERPLPPAPASPDKTASTIPAEREAQNGTTLNKQRTVNFWIAAEKNWVDYLGLAASL